MSTPIDHNPATNPDLPTQPTAHCELCHHMKRSLQTGTLCGLTEEKPAFSGLCPDFQFHANVPGKIGDMKYNLSSEQHSKMAIIMSLVMHGLIGVVLLVVGYLLNDYLYDMGYMAVLPYAMMIMGIVAVVRGISSYLGANSIRETLIQEQKQWNAIVRAYGSRVPKK